MKTVTIPNDYHPYEVEVNGKEYRFPAGATVSVPDEVAAVIENYYKLQPKEKPTDGGTLPYVSPENNGDILTVKDGAWTTGEGGGSGESGWKYFTWDEPNYTIDFYDNETRDYYLNTPEPFYVTVDGGEVRLAVITPDSGSNHWLTYTTEGDVYSLQVFVYEGLSDGVIILDGSTGNPMRALPLTNSAEPGEVLTIGENGIPGWVATSNLFPKVTITQEDLGSQILNIGAFTAQANDTIKMKTFSFTGTAGSSIIGKILEILNVGVGFIEIEGFGVQALAYKMSQIAVSTTQTFGYFADPTQPFLFSADYVIQDLVEGNVDLNFYVQKINVVS